MIMNATPDSGGDRVPVIDAHHHFWRTAEQEQPWRQAHHQQLERDFEPHDLMPELDRAGIDGTVLIQSVDEAAENQRLIDYAAHPRVLGVVGWLPLQDQLAARAELDRPAPRKLAGVRCLIADDPLKWLSDPEAVKLFGDLADRGLSWDVVPITAQQIEAIVELAEAVPELRIIVDHLGRPPLERGGWQPWAGQLQRLASCPSVAVKISVGIDALSAWDHWETQVLRPYVDHLLEQFGPERLMLASNWPVVLLGTDYQTAWHDLAALLARDLDPAETSAVLGGTATRWYRLPIEP